MSALHSQELLSKLVDGQLVPPEWDDLSQLAAENSAFAQQIREELYLVDLIEQNLNPERSYQAFLNGLETRVRAEETSEAFMEELLPKLKEVDDREALERKIVPFPTFGPAFGWGVAAAAAVVFTLLIVFKQGDDSNEILATLSYSEAEVEWASNSAEKGIEWADGASIAAGDSLKLKKGRVKLLYPNGNVVVLEGESDLTVESETQSQVNGGQVFAAVSSENQSIVFKTNDTEVEVQSGTTGFLRVGDSTESVSPSLSFASGVIEHTGPVEIALSDSVPKNEADQKAITVTPGESSDQEKADAPKGVRSYVVEVKTDDSGEVLEGSITFDQPILGVSTSNEMLSAMDIDDFLESVGYDETEGLKIRIQGQTLGLKMKGVDTENLSKVRVFVAEDEDAKHDPDRAPVQTGPRQ